MERAQQVGGIKSWLKTIKLWHLGAADVSNTCGTEI